MRINLEEYQHNNKEKTLYNYYSAKKIYFACTPSKYLLIEKKDTKVSVRTVSLKSHNAFLISKDGMLFFPEKR